MQVWSNNAISTLSASIAAGDLTIFIQPSHGTRFPVVSGSNFCWGTLEDASGNIEIVKVTAHSSGGSSFTVLRGQQGTTARSYIIGDLFELRATAYEFGEWETDIDDLEATRARKAGDTYTGTHDFSGATQVMLPANTNIGGVSSTEIAALDGITGNIQAQLNLKGNINSQVWTGSHVFPATVTIGAVTATEIAYLSGVTSALQPQIDGKSNRSGDIYTGAHNYSGAGSITVPTMPTGTNTGDAASCAFVQQVAFASYANLPADPGDAVTRVLTTFSGTKSWAIPPASDVAQYLAGIV